jgi:hypothetical protein
MMAGHGESLMAERSWVTPLLAGEERRRQAEGFEIFRPQREEADRITRVERVIEISSREPAANPEGPRCCRLRSDGRRCDLPAVEGDQCLHHWRWYSVYTSMHGLPFPEDALSLQEMLGYAVDMVLSRRISAQEAFAIAQLGRVMQKNLVGCELEMRALARRR